MELISQGFCALLELSYTLSKTLVTLLFAFPFIWLYTIFPSSLWAVEGGDLVLASLSLWLHAQWWHNCVWEWINHSRNAWRILTGFAPTLHSLGPILVCQIWNKNLLFNPIVYWIDQEWAGLLRLLFHLAQLMLINTEPKTQLIFL